MVELEAAELVGKPVDKLERLFGSLEGLVGKPVGEALAGGELGCGSRGLNLFFRPTSAETAPSAPRGFFLGGNIAACVAQAYKARMAMDAH